MKIEASEFRSGDTITSEVLVREVRQSTLGVEIRALYQRTATVEVKPARQPASGEIVYPKEISRIQWRENTLLLDPKNVVTYELASNNKWLRRYTNSPAEYVGPNFFKYATDIDCLIVAKVPDLVTKLGVNRNEYV